jgi:hypothetical protein
LNGTGGISWMKIEGSIIRMVERCYIYQEVEGVSWWMLLNADYDVYSLVIDDDWRVIVSPSQADFTGGCGVFRYRSVCL